MRHVAAYLLASLGGNENPSASDIKAILSSVGVEADDKGLKTVVDSLKGKVRSLTWSKIIFTAFGRIVVGFTDSVLNCVALAHINIKE